MLFLRRQHLACLLTNTSFVPGNMLGTWLMFDDYFLNECTNETELDITLTNATLVANSNEVFPEHKAL